MGIRYFISISCRTAICYDFSLIYLVASFERLTCPWINSYRSAFVQMPVGVFDFFPLTIPSKVKRLPASSLSPAYPCGKLPSLSRTGCSVTYLSDREIVPSHMAYKGVPGSAYRSILFIQRADSAAREQCQSGKKK